MRVQLNGRERQLEVETTLAQLVAGLNLGRVRIAVERNLEIVPRGTYDATVLTDGDRLEIVTFVGGG